MRLLTVFMTVLLCLSLSMTGCTETKIVTPDTEEKVDSVLGDAIDLLTDLLLSWLNREGDYTGELAQYYSFEGIEPWEKDLFPDRKNQLLTAQTPDELRVSFSVWCTKNNFWYAEELWCVLYRIHLAAFYTIPDTIIIMLGEQLENYNGEPLPDVSEVPLC